MKICTPKKSENTEPDTYHGPRAVAFKLVTEVDFRSRQTGSMSGWTDGEICIDP